MESVARFRTLKPLNVLCIVTAATLRMTLHSSKGATYLSAAQLREDEVDTEESDATETRGDSFMKCTLLLLPENLSALTFTLKEYTASARRTYKKKDGIA